LQFSQFQECGEVSQTNCQSQPKQEPFMFANQAQISELQKTQIDALFALSNTLFQATERFVGLNIAATKALMEESTECAQGLMGVKDVQELIAVSNGLAQPAFDKLVAYSRNVYSIANEAGSEVTKIVEAQVATSNKKLSQLIDVAAKNAPTGSESAVSMLKNSLTAANTAYDTISKATKQAVEMVESNLSAATNATLKSVNAANDAAKGKTKKAA
jgi:phasin family protein